MIHSNWANSHFLVLNCLACCSPISFTYPAEDVADGVRVMCPQCGEGYIVINAYDDALHCGQYALSPVELDEAEIRMEIERRLSQNF